MDLSGYDLIGIGHPVYSFSTPKNVRVWADTLPSLKKKVFIFKTAGDDSVLNYAASDGLIRKLRKKGYDVFYDRLFVIGSNWLFAYDKQLAKQLYISAEKNAAHMAGEVLNGTRRLYNINVFQQLLSTGVGRLGTGTGAKFFGKSLTADSRCIGCFKCVKSCPAKNIRVAADRPVFGKECIWCMRCIYGCPVRAIESGYMGFCILKEGYSLEEIIKDTKLPPYLEDETK